MVRPNQSGSKATPLSVGGIVGLFVGTGDVVAALPAKLPVVADPEEPTAAAAGPPRGDAGENRSGDDDVVPVLRVEIASDERACALDQSQSWFPRSAERWSLRVHGVEAVFSAHGGVTP